MPPVRVPVVHADLQAPKMRSAGYRYCGTSRGILLAGVPLARPARPNPDIQRDFRALVARRALPERFADVRLTARFTDFLAFALTFDFVFLATFAISQFSKC